MIVYQLHIDEREDDGEGEDHDEWFSSLTAAKRRRAQLIRERPPEDYKYGSDFQIDRVSLTRTLSPKRLALAILNRRGFVANREAAVVPEYTPPTGRR